MVIAKSQLWPAEVNTHTFPGETDEHREDRQKEHRTWYLWERASPITAMVHSRCISFYLQTSKPDDPADRH